MGLFSCLASYLAWGFQHWGFLAIGRIWVLVLTRKSLGELSLIDIIGARRCVVVQCPLLGPPTLEAQAQHPAREPRPCQLHSSEEKEERLKKQKQKQTERTLGQMVKQTDKITQRSIHIHIHKEKMKKKKYIYI